MRIVCVLLLSLFVTSQSWAGCHDPRYTYYDMKVEGDYLRGTIEIDREEKEWFVSCKKNRARLDCSSITGSPEKCPAGERPFSGSPFGQIGPTLSGILQQGSLRCGVSTGLPGFSNLDGSGHWSGIDVDVCRAVAAAVLGDASRVTFRPLLAREHFAALQSGEIDVLSRSTTWTLTRDTGRALNFVGVSYYDGKGFMVRKKLGVKSALQLDGATVCVVAGTAAELNLDNYFRSHNMRFDPVRLESTDEVLAAYEAERCDVLTSEKGRLAVQRTKLKDSGAHVILPENISVEPLGPVVREGDDNWQDIVKWSIYAMLDAEELGITSGNVDVMRTNPANSSVKRLLGMEGDLGESLGLTRDWAYNIIRQVGNYAETFDRNIGMGSDLGLDRGLNALWKNGGLQYSLPLR